MAATVLSTREAFAFVRASHGSRPCLIALQNCRERRVCELVEAAVAACSAFDVSEALEEKRSHVVAELARGESITAWREEDTYYAAYAHESPSLELSSGDTRATGMQFA